MLTLFWLALFIIGIFAFWSLIYALLFIILKLHLDDRTNQMKEIQKKDAQLTTEQARFVNGSARTLSLSMPFLYFLMNSEWKLLKKNFWKIQMIPGIQWYFKRNIRRVIWESRLWPDFETYHSYQKKCEQRAACVWGILFIFFFALIWFIIINFYDELYKLVINNGKN